MGTCVAYAALANNAHPYADEGQVEVARIVVADDDENIREVLALQLRGLGHQVAEVDSGRAAVLAVSQSKPDLVVCDLHMPDGDGWWVLDSINTARAGDPVPVIIITGDDSPDLERRALKRGADALFGKPWLMAQLRDAVGRALDSSRSSAQTSPS